MQAVCQSHHPVNEIPIRSDEFVIHPVDILVPSEICIMGLWHVDGEVISECVRVISLQV